MLDEELKQRAQKISELQNLEVQNKQLLERVNQLETQQSDTASYAGYKDYYFTSITLH